MEGGSPTHSPPLHATHLTGTVSGLSELFVERPLSTTSKIHGRRNKLYFILFQRPARVRACFLPEIHPFH